jgi:hypothetical protein
VRELNGILAEEEGFEPPDPCGSTVFKTVALDRSATPPALPGLLATSVSSRGGSKARGVLSDSMPPMRRPTSHDASLLSGTIARRWLPPGACAEAWP